MSITGLHIPHGDSPLAAVTVNERNATSYYPYVQGGPVEAGHLTIEGIGLAVYVNSRYAQFDEEMINLRATALFEMAGVGMFGGTGAGRCIGRARCRQRQLRAVSTTRGDLDLSGS